MQVLLHPTDQPVFRLRGSAAGCSVDLRINDVPIHRDAGGLAHEFDIAVNEWLFQGENVISVFLAPVKEGGQISPGAIFDVRLIHKVARDVHRNTTEIGEMSWKAESPNTPSNTIHAHGHESVAPVGNHDEGVEESSPLLALPGQPEELLWVVGPASVNSANKVRIHSLLPLPPPWPVCPWSSCSMLSAQTGSYHAVSNLLRSLHHRFRLGAWRELMQRRFAAIQAAYYLGPDEVDDALGFPSLLNQAGWSLQTLPDTKHDIEYAGNGRLVRLLDPVTSDPPLALFNDSAAVMASIDVWWMFDKEWVIIR